MFKWILALSWFAPIPFCLLGACGKEVGRVPFSGEGTHSATLALASGQVAFWTDLDVQFDGAADLQYRIQLLQAGSPVATVVCLPLAELPVRMNWVSADIGRSHSRHGHGKMDCSATLPSAGPTTVEATLAFASKPGVFTLTRADLILKQ